MRLHVLYSKCWLLLKSPEISQEGSRGNKECVRWDCYVFTRWTDCFFLTSPHLCVFHTNALAIKYLLMCQNPYGVYANENNKPICMHVNPPYGQNFLNKCQVNHQGIANRTLSSFGFDTHCQIHGNKPDSNRSHNLQAAPQFMGQSSSWFLKNAGFRSELCFHVTSPRPHGEGFQESLESNLNPSRHSSPPLPGPLRGLSEISQMRSL